MDLNSEKYTRVDVLYNINDLNNILSIFKYGLLSKNNLRRRNIKSVDLSNPEVQSLRARKLVVGRFVLHDYANLYFDARNPMMYNVTKHSSIDDLCVICIDKRVLDLKNTVVTDRNAATELALFETPDKGLKFIDFNKVFAEFWTDSNPAIQSDKKAIKCAEVLVLNEVPVEYLIKIKVATLKAKKIVENLNLGVLVEIDSHIFFR